MFQASKNYVRCKIQVEKHPMFLLFFKNDKTQFIVVHSSVHSLLGRFHRKATYLHLSRSVEEYRTCNNWRNNFIDS